MGLVCVASIYNNNPCENKKCKHHADSVNTIHKLENKIIQLKGEKVCIGYEINK